MADELPEEPQPVEWPSWRRLVVAGLGLALVAAAIQSVSRGAFSDVPRLPYTPEFVSDELLVFGAFFLELVAIAALGVLLAGRRRRWLALVGLLLTAALVPGEVAVADRFFGALDCQTRSGGFADWSYRFYSGKTALFHWPIYRVVLLARGRTNVTTGGGMRGARVGGTLVSGDRCILVQSDGTVEETRGPIRELLWSLGDQDAFDRAIVRRSVVGGERGPTSADLCAWLAEQVRPEDRDAALERFIGASRGRQ